MNSLNEQVDQLFASWDRAGSPGCALGIIQDGAVVYKRGYGMANLEHDIPITTQSRFYMASVSKQFAAMCIALLIEAGALALDDDIRKYIPEFPDYGRPVTVYHLIYHTSGLPDYHELRLIAGRSPGDDWTEAEVMEYIMRQKRLNFEPGGEYLYTNAGYVTLAHLVRRVTGQSLRQFAHENIFKPLGMHNTVFRDDHVMVIKNLATGYEHRPDRGDYAKTYRNLETVGDGGLFSCVDDLVLWDQNFYDNRLGKGAPDLISLTLKTRPLTDGTENDYAFGLRLSSYRGLNTISHGGGFAGARTLLFRFPEQRFTVICLSNLGTFDPDKLTLRIADLYLADAFTEPAEASVTPIDLPTASYRDKVGIYQDPDTGILIELAAQGNALITHMSGMPFPVHPLSETHFRADDSAPLAANLHFERSNDRWAFTLRITGEKPVTYYPVEIVPPTADQIKSYAGTYYNAELQTTYEIQLRDGGLFVDHRQYSQVPLKALTGDTLHLAGIMRLHFERGPQGTITGFTLNGERVRHLHFQRIAPGQAHAASMVTR